MDVVPRMRKSTLERCRKFSADSPDCNSAHKNPKDPLIRNGFDYCLDEDNNGDFGEAQAGDVHYIGRILGLYHCHTCNGLMCREHTFKAAVSWPPLNLSIGVPYPFAVAIEIQTQFNAANT